jgi:predicted enzyme related to lactoylglutathione lyase
MSDLFKTPGAVSWTELSTRDATAAKGFYGELFGWRFEDTPMGDGGSYAVISVGDQQIGGIMNTPPAARDKPPMWGSYVTVNDLSAIIDKACSLGGQLLHGPQDIPDVGRFAWIQDPQGATIHAIEYAMS